MAGRLRVHTEYNNNALTLPDYFTGRFEDKSRILRIISALVILLFFTIYCASGIVAGARLFESTFGMSYETALWLVLRRRSFTPLLAVSSRAGLTPYRPA